MHEPAPEPARRPLSPVLLLGFAVGSAGGPLAIATVYLLSVAGVPPPLLVATTILGLALFAVPLSIWRHYSQEVASDGGLYAFVRHAAGERVARWQGWIWTVAYLLYLPYTITYIVFYLLPELLPLRPAQSAALELLLPAGICALIAFGGQTPIALLLVSGAAQLLAVVALGALTLHAVGTAAPVPALPAGHAWPGVLGGAAQVASLLICMSLVLFLGEGDAAGRGRMRWALAWAYAILCAFTVFSAVFLSAGATPAVTGSDLPGAALARAHGFPVLGIAVGLLTLGSIGGLIVAEFIGLARLWHAMFRLRERTSVAIIAAFFLVGDAVSLIGPRRFYALTLTPSLVALYLSQLIVFAAYPWFARRGGRLSLRAACLAGVACLWALYEVYGTVAGRLPS